MISRRNGIDWVLKWAPRTYERAIQILLNRYLFLLGLVVVAAYGAILNFNAKDMFGLVPAYEQFGNFLASGWDFESEPGKRVYTFPMWGYGLLFFITKSKSTIIILQQIFTIAVIMGIDFSLEKLKWKKVSRVIFRFLMLSCVIWFYFHAILWPYSWGANLLLVSLFSLIFYLRTNKLWMLMISAVAFGIMLNFRSDYFYFAIGLGAALLLLRFVRQLNFKVWHLAIWFGIVAIMLAPWAIFSNTKAGTPLLKSTNGGHVLFISLGQLPENKWGITPLDADPTMRALVDENVGKGISTLSYAADTFLTSKWVELISEDRSEFLAKCKHNLQQIISQPYYNGSILQPSEGYADRYIVSNLDSAWQSYSNSLAQDPENTQTIGGRSYRLFLIHAKIFRWLGLGLIVFLVLNWRVMLRDPFFIVLLLIVGYQLALIILAYFMIAYNTNLVPVYTLLFVYFFIEKIPWGRYWQWAQNKLQPILMKYWLQLEQRFNNRSSQ